MISVWNTHTYTHAHAHTYTYTYTTETLVDFSGDKRTNKVMSHVTHMNESWHTHMTHSYVWHDSFICVTWLIHVTHMNESCHTYEWVMSHIWMSHVSADESKLTCVCANSRANSRVPQRHALLCPTYLFIFPDNGGHMSLLSSTHTHTHTNTHTMNRGPNMTDSIKNVTAPRSTATRNSVSPISCGTSSNRKFSPIWICTKECECVGNELCLDSVVSGL